MGLGLAGRRLRRLFDASTIVITIKQRTADEASAIAADMDAAWLCHQAPLPEVARSMMYRLMLSRIGLVANMLRLFERVS